MPKKSRSAPAPAIRETRASILRHRRISEQAAARNERAQARNRRREVPVIDQDLPPQPPRSVLMPIPFVSGLQVTPERSTQTQRATDPALASTQSVQDTTRGSARGTQGVPATEVSSSVEYLYAVGAPGPRDGDQSTPSTQTVAIQQQSDVEMGTYGSTVRTSTGAPSAPVTGDQGLAVGMLIPTQPPAVASPERSQGIPTPRMNFDDIPRVEDSSRNVQASHGMETGPLVRFQEVPSSSRLSTQRGETRDTTNQGSSTRNQTDRGDEAPAQSMFVPARRPSPSVNGSREYQAGPSVPQLEGQRAQTETPDVCSDIRDRLQQHQLEINRLTRLVNNMPNVVARQVGRAMEEIYGSLSSTLTKELEELKTQLREEGTARAVADEDDRKRAETQLAGLTHELQREKDKVQDLESQVRFLMRVREAAEERVRSPTPRGTHRPSRYRRRYSPGSGDASPHPPARHDGRSCGCCLHGLHGTGRRSSRHQPGQMHDTQPAVTDESDPDDDYPGEPLRPRAATWRGPRQAGLTELRPTDEAFRPAVSYRRYRLRNIDQHADVNTNAQIGQFSRLLRHNLETFDGNEPIGILEFLANFKQQCDENGVSEGLAVRLLPKFLGGDAKDTFDSYVDTGVYGLGGAKTYPEAVNHLLHVYARDSVIEQAVEKLNTMKQGEKETESDFGRRLRRQARKCGNVFSEKQLITRFVRGTHENIKPLLRATQGGNETNQSYSNYVERAQALGTAHRALATSSRQKRSAVNLIGNSEVGNYAPNSGAPNEAVLALADEFPPSRNGTATEDTAYDRLLQEPPSESTDTTPTPPDSQVVNYLEKKYPYPNRVGWKDGDRQRKNDHSYKAAGRNPAKYPEKRAMPNQPDDICFECYAVGHRKPNCPHLERSAYDTEY